MNNARRKRLAVREVVVWAGALIASHHPNENDGIELELHQWLRCVEMSNAQESPVSRATNGMSTATTCCVGIRSIAKSFRWCRVIVSLHHTKRCRFTNTSTGDTTDRRPNPLHFQTVILALTARELRGDSNPGACAPTAGFQTGFEPATYRLLTCCSYQFELLGRTNRNR